MMPGEHPSFILCRAAKRSDIGEWGDLNRRQSLALEESRLQAGRDQARNGLDQHGYLPNDPQYLFKNSNRDC